MNGVWSTAEIAGKTADVYDPPGDRPGFGVVHLHPHSLKTISAVHAYSRWFDQFNLACVCPHGGPCWWADRVCPDFDPQVTPERHVLDAVVPYFRERWGLPPRSLAIQGICMGGQGALRLAFKHPDTFAVVAAFAPAIE